MVLNATFNNISIIAWWSVLLAEENTWCLTPRSTIFQLYRGAQFFGWKKPEDPEKTIDLSQVADKGVKHHQGNKTSIKIQ
jgi:hypothetical protein